MLGIATPCLPRTCICGILAVDFEFCKILPGAGNNIDELVE